MPWPFKKKEKKSPSLNVTAPNTTSSNRLQIGKTDIPIIPVGTSRKFHPINAAALFKELRTSAPREQSTYFGKGTSTLNKPYDLTRGEREGITAQYEAPEKPAPDVKAEKGKTTFSFESGEEMTFGRAGQTLRTELAGMPEDLRKKAMESPSSYLSTEGVVAFNELSEQERQSALQSTFLTETQRQAYIEGQVAAATAQVEPPPEPATWADILKVAAGEAGSMAAAGAAGGAVLAGIGTGGVGSPVGAIVGGAGGAISGFIKGMYRGAEQRAGERTSFAADRYRDNVAIMRAIPRGVAAGFDPVEAEIMMERIDAELRQAEVELEIASRTIYGREREKAINDLTTVQQVRRMMLPIYRQRIPYSAASYLQRSQYLGLGMPDVDQGLPEVPELQS